MSVDALDSAAAWSDAVVPEAAVQAMRWLWTAADPDSIVAAARTLLGELAAGALVQRCAREVAPADVDSSLYRLQAGLPGDEMLTVTIPNGLLTSAARSAAEAIGDRVRALTENATLKASVDRLERAERLQRALYAIADQASLADTDLARLFAALHHIVASLMYAENFYIALYDREKDSVRFPYYADTVDRDPPDQARDFPASEIVHGPTWYVIHRGKPLMGSLADLELQVGGPFRAVGTPCVDWLGVPLLRGATAVGCVAVQSYDDSHHYSDADQAVLIYLAQHIQTSLERRVAHFELEQRVAERTEALRTANRGLQQQVLERKRGEQLQAALVQIAKLAATTTKMDEFYGAVQRVVDGLLHARNFCIALLSDDRMELTFPYVVDEHGPVPGTRKLGRGLTEFVLRRGVTVLADASELERLYAAGEIVPIGAARAASWLGVPLVRAEHPIGVLAVWSYSAEHQYTSRDQEVLTFLSYHIANALELVCAAESLHRTHADLERRVEERTQALASANRDLRTQILERERVEARLEHQALHDALTGLPNRTLLMEQLRAALRRFRSDPVHGFAVVFIDLDRFKIVNDSVGHLAGDSMLFQAASRLRACVKWNDVVARLGGDEFGVLLEGIAKPDVACRLAGRIIDAFNAPFRIGTKDLFTSASIGIALCSDRYREPEELLRDADAAMYRAKADGRHCCRVFDEGLRREALSLLEVENDLRASYRQHAFVPYYQPIVAMSDGHVVGYEALMRWRHPQRGVLLPDEFLGVAEDNGIIETIDWEIFEQVFREAPKLIQTPACFIAINLSARHFRDPELDRRLLGLFVAHHVLPAAVRVEVTERAMLENPSEAKRILQALRDAGTLISLDDFGTGYSSLSYLHQYPVQAIKIDRSFVTGLATDGGRGSEAIIRTIIAMAKLLSMQVIAEGVETMAQRNQLLHMGCGYAQGFLYGQAQPLANCLGEVPPSLVVGEAVVDVRGG